MTAPHDVVNETVARLAFTSPSSVTWYGRTVVALPAKLRRRMSEEQLHHGLVYLLQQHLYEHVYTTGSPTPSRDRVRFVPADAARTEFVQRLSRANAGQGGWDPGWVPSRTAPHVVSRGGLRVSARPGSLRQPTSTSDSATDHAPTGPDGVEMWRPKELPAASPGYYVALGDRDLPAQGTATLVRWYWNLVPEGAEAFVRLLTGSMNDQRIPFQLKTLSDPAQYQRCDAGVLYVPRADTGAVAEAVHRVLPTLRPYLKGATPAFTKRLASGLGLAEDPPGRESFGLSRAHLLADGLVGAHERGLPRAERVRAVIEHFEAHGISMSAPHLNPGSDADYDGDFDDHRAASSSPRSAASTPSDDDCRATARSIGQALLELALWSDEECTWIAPTPGTSQDITSISFGGVGTDLYSGTAGIAWFLGDLHAAEPDEGLRATALGAIHYALGSVETGTSPRTGLFDGALGVALVAARLAAPLGDPKLVATAADVVASVCARPSPSPDLLGGAAGLVLGILDRHAPVEESVRRAALGRWADELVASVQSTPDGASWTWSGQPTFRNPTGLSHGTSGIALALDALATYTGREDLANYAAHARFYERNAFAADEGNWADYRLPPGRRTRWTPRYSVAWCHGATGIALDRMHSHQLHGDDESAEEARTALGTTTRWLHHALDVSSPDFSLCHGIAGNLQVVEMGASLLGPDLAPDPTPFVQHGMSRYRGGPGLDAEPPGLMNGLAGVGSFFLERAGHTAPNPLTMFLDVGGRTPASPRQDRGSTSRLRRATGLPSK